LEGSDQHRGWFQSSILTSVAVNGKAPFKAVVTHGFVLDEKGMKMSKSQGNVVDPMHVIEGGCDKKKNPAYGADTLRLWVSSVDFAGDVCIGDTLMKSMSDVYRKFRNTLRFIVGSIDDFHPLRNQVSIVNLPSLDRYILGRLSEVEAEVESAYEKYQFFRVHQLLLNFCSMDLSSFYLDIAKDRLYISSQDDPRRRSCQTVLYLILEKLAIMLAPITPHLSEELWLNLPYEKASKSIFELGWNSSTTYPAFNNEMWTKVKLLRDDVNGCIELARRNKAMGASVEAKIFLHCDDEKLKDFLSRMIDRSHSLVSTDTNCVDDLRFVFLTSQVELVESADQVKRLTHEYYVDSSSSISGLTVGVTPADGLRCERCWYYCSTVGKQSHNSDLCSRCHTVVQNKNK
jgi:isoleucyl-tRNA synthetase